MRSIIDVQPYTPQADAPGVQRLATLCEALAQPLLTTIFWDLREWARVHVPYMAKCMIGIDHGPTVSSICFRRPVGEVFGFYFLRLWLEPEGQLCFGRGKLDAVTSDKSWLPYHLIVAQMGRSGLIPVGLLSF